MNELLVSQTNRQLDRTVKIAGFELFDLFIIFSLLSVLSLLLGGSPFKIPIAWGGSATVAIILFFTKRGKAPNYLINKLRYGLRPGIYYARSFDLEFQRYFKDESELK